MWIYGLSAKRLSHLGACSNACTWKLRAALLRRYDPEFVPNQSDDTGRYRYEEQPAACYWNCEKLAEALKAVLSKGRALSWLQSNFYLEFQRCAKALLLCHGVLGSCRSQGMHDDTNGSLEAYYKEPLLSEADGLAARCL